MSPLPILAALTAPLILAGALAAQSCVYIPDGNPAAGPTDVKPFGSVNQTDPQWSNQKMMIQIPKAQLGTTRRAIHAIGFAPAASRLRQFQEIRIRMGHNPNPTMDATFFRNMTGFTSSLLMLRDYDWQTTAGRWNRICTELNFTFDPALGDLVVELVVGGAGSSGSGDAGFHLDPSLQMVHAAGWRLEPSTGTVALGAPRIEVCFDTNELGVHGRGCPGSNGTPALSFTGSGRPGMLANAHLSNGPGGNGVAILLMGFRLVPIDLEPFGAPGCRTYPRLDFVSVLPTTNGTATLSLPVPFGINGGKLFLQLLPFDPGANPLGFSATPFGWILVGN